MKTRQRTLWIALLATMVSAVALADGDQLTGTGTTYWSRSQLFTPTAACVTEREGSSNCLLFPASRTEEHKRFAVYMKAARPLRCSYAGAPALAINANCTITDSSGPYGSGPGSCIVFHHAGATSDEKPSWQTLINHASSGARTGLCSTLAPSSGNSIYPNGGDWVYAPCLVDADCTLYGGGTCIALASLTTDQQKYAGLFLNCQAITNTASVAVQKQDVPRW